MDEQLSPSLHEEVSKATRLAEHGNGSRLRDLVQDIKDFDEHSKIINAMLNLNKQNLQNFEIQEKAGMTPAPVSRLKLEEIPRTVNGELIITRSLSSDGQTIFREVYNKSKKAYEDPGSCPRPSGIIPHFIPKSK